MNELQLWHWVIVSDLTQKTGLIISVDQMAKYSTSGSFALKKSHFSWVNFVYTPKMLYMSGSSEIALSI